MQMHIGTTDLTSAPFGVESYDMGKPRLTSDAQAHDAAGYHPMAFPGNRHEDCDYSVTLVISDTTAAGVEAHIAEALALFVAGARLTLTDGYASSSRYTFLRSVSEPVIVHRGKWARLTLSGTRDAYWFGSQEDVASTTVSDLAGTFDVDGVLGDVPALTRYYVSSECDGIVLGVREADSGFQWEQSESGSSNAAYIGGAAKVTTLTDASTYYDVSTTRTLTTDSYSDAFLVIARVNTSAAITRFRVSVGGVTSEHSAVDAGIGLVAIGPVTVPQAGWTRDFPPTAVKVQASSPTAGATVALDSWWLVGAPSAVRASAAIVHTEGSMCLDGIPTTTPNVYGYDRDTDTIGASSIGSSTLLGWPMLRPGDNTVSVVLDGSTVTDGAVSLSYIPRYLTTA